MFTSRSEYRVSLRPDNADLRLTPLGRAVGVVSDARWSTFESTKGEIDRGTELLEGLTHGPHTWNLSGFDMTLDGALRR